MVLLKEQLQMEKCLLSVVKIVIINGSKSIMCIVGMLLLSLIHLYSYKCSTLFVAEESKINLISSIEYVLVIFSGSLYLQLLLFRFWSLLLEADSSRSINIMA